MSSEQRTVSDSEIKETILAYLKHSPDGVNIMEAYASMHPTVSMERFHAVLRDMDVVRIVCSTIKQRGK